jgi:hypothetical protein
VGDPPVRRSDRKDLQGEDALDVGGVRAVCVARGEPRDSAVI